MDNTAELIPATVPKDKPVYNINYQVNGENATLPLVELEQLIAERNQYFGDINAASEHINRLLKTLSIIDKDGEFQEPVMGKVVGVITKMFLSNKPGPFAHIMELKPMLLFYSQLQNNKQCQKETTTKLLS
jgi:hypothetical protein